MEYEPNPTSEDTVVEERHQYLGGYRKTGNTLPITINSKRDASSILYMAWKEQRDCELAVKDAIAQLRHAILEAKSARDHLLNMKQQLVAAEMQVGEARLTVKTSGFGSILQSGAQQTRLFGVQVKDNYLVSVSGATFAVKLD